MRTTSPCSQILARAFVTSRHDSINLRPAPASVRCLATAAFDAPPVASSRSQRRSRRIQRRTIVALALAVGIFGASYAFIQPFRYTVIAVKRCSVVGIAVVLDILDCKYLFWRSWAYEDEMDSERGKAARADRHEAYSACHKRCAERILEALKVCHTNHRLG